MRRKVAIALAGLLTVACKRSGQVGPAIPAKAVKCAPAQSAAIKDAIEVRGTVAPLPDRDAQVAPQVVGRILRVEVREGDRVARGQVVARIDDATLIDAAHQSEAALARARAEYKNAQTTRMRVQRVFEHGIATRQEVDDTTAKEASAKAATDEAVAAARQAHRQIERATVRSPLAGVVLKVLRKAGELVDGTPATPVVEIADISKLELVADVPAQDLVRLARGADGTVRFPALPDFEYRATVAQVSPSVDRATGIGRVRVAVGWPGKTQNASAGPPVGAFGVARIEIGAAHQAVLVPQAAVRSVVGGEGEIVICGADQVAHVRKVARGLAQGALVEVRGRIAATDRVAVAPVLGISDGDRIEVAQ
jgi:RND family efflux transporter MFP subunit